MFSKLGKALGVARGRGDAGSRSCGTGKRPPPAWAWRPAGRDSDADSHADSDADAGRDSDAHTVSAAGPDADSNAFTDSDPDTRHRVLVRNPVDGTGHVELDVDVFRVARTVQLVQDEDLSHVRLGMVRHTALVLGVRAG